MLHAEFNCSFVAYSTRFINTKHNNHQSLFSSSNSHLHWNSGIPDRVRSVPLPSIDIRSAQLPGFETYRCSKQPTLTPLHNSQPSSATALRHIIVLATHEDDWASGVSLSMKFHDRRRSL